MTSWTFNFSTFAFLLILPITEGTTKFEFHGQLFCEKDNFNYQITIYEDDIYMYVLRLTIILVSISYRNDDVSFFFQ